MVLNEMAQMSAQDDVYIAGQIKKIKDDNEAIRESIREKMKTMKRNMEFVKNNPELFSKDKLDIIQVRLNEIKVDLNELLIVSGSVDKDFDIPNSTIAANVKSESAQHYFKIAAASEERKNRTLKILYNDLEALNLFIKNKS